MSTWNTCGGISRELTRYLSMISGVYRGKSLNGFTDTRIDDTLV